MFLIGSIDKFDSLNYYDKNNNNPGLRGILTIGHRFEYDHVDFGEDLIEGIIIHNPRKFQMNTAFSKAYIIEESGSSKGMIGLSLYIDELIILGHSKLRKM